MIDWTWLIPAFGGGAILGAGLMFYAVAWSTRKEFRAMRAIDKAMRNEWEVALEDLRQRAATIRPPGSAS